MFCMLAVCLLAPIMNINHKAVAASSKLNLKNFSDNISKIFDDFCEFKTRIAGSENEKQASEYILNYLNNVEGLIAVTNASTNEGVQEFEFVSDYTGTYKSSQNIVFKYESKSETDKTVILGCHYDAPVYFDAESGEYRSYENDALNCSAGSVATLLTLAEYLPNYNLKFNIEFAFFGAGESSFAGSEFYVDGISDEMAENVLCMINIDKVALGEDLYFYIDEVETDFSKYILSIFDTSKIGTKKVNLVNLNKTSYIQNELGLTYSHIALNSDNIKFMGRGISTINLFAGDYDDGLVFGRCEYVETPELTYSELDKLSYIEFLYGKEEVPTNLYKVYETIEAVLTDSDFVKETTGAYNQAGWFYTIFANEKLVVYLTAVIFIIILAVAFYIHYKLTINSYYANVEVEFLSSVVKISEHIDGNGVDKNIPKVVSQVIANDIKKNKTLNPEKKKPDDEKNNHK